jgi:SPP1 gp7 family putative phage head morphogenesis protein
MAKSYDKDGGGSGTSLQDIYLRHGINLTRYSTYEAHRLQDILDTENKQIKALITKSKGVETKQKYRRIAAEIKRISSELDQQLIGQVELDFTELAQAETEFVEKAMRTIGVTADFVLPAPAKVWAAASFGNYTADGRETFETYLNGLSENLYKTWDTNVRAGYLAGLTAKQINRSVLGSVKDMEAGQMQGLRQSLEKNTRTMIASMAEEARDSTYRANSGLFSGYRFLGTLDTRTCPVCGSLDGRVFKTLEEAPKLPAHYNCRCLYLPVIKGMEEPLEGDERASANGPVPASMTYKEWFGKQSPEVQRDILGSTRYAAYKNGVPIAGFVSDGRTLTLEQLKAKEGIGAIPTAGGSGKPPSIPPSGRFIPPNGEDDDWIRENGRRAREEANRLFPNETWLQKEEWGDRIFVSSHRAIGKKSNFTDELRDAEILRDLGGTVYLVQENNRRGTRQYDSITNGLMVEYKNQRGASIRTLKDHFLASRGQAPNVFINLEESPLSRKSVLKTLYRARNSADYLEKSKNIIGGTIILKIKGIENLLFFDADNLKTP